MRTSSFTRTWKQKMYSTPVTPTLGTTTTLWIQQSKRWNFKYFLWLSSLCCPRTLPRWKLCWHLRRHLGTGNPVILHDNRHHAISGRYSGQTEKVHSWGDIQFASLPLRNLPETDKRSPSASTNRTILCQTYYEQWMDARNTVLQTFTAI